jgi:hypothetical protein
VRIRAYQLIDFQLFCQATVTPCYHRRGFRRVYLRQVMDPTWNGVSCHMIFRPAFAFEFYPAQSTIAATLEHIRLNPEQPNVESPSNLHKISKEIQDKLKIGLKLAVQSAAIHPATC